MKLARPLALPLLSILVAHAAPRPALAQGSTLVVGLPVSNDCLPFGCGEFLSIRHQQFYDASAFAAFAAPVLIRGFSLFNSVTPGNWLPPGDFAVRLGVSTETRATTTVDLDANLRGALQPFATLHVAAAFQPGDRFTVVGTTPFFYDPALGNLVVDVDATALGSTWPERPGVYWAADDRGTATWSAFSSPSQGSGVWSAGAVTEFEVAAVPEPQSLGLVAMGLAGGALFIVTRRRRGRRER